MMYECVAKSYLSGGRGKDGAQSRCLLSAKQEGKAKKKKRIGIRGRS
jgi:hypothetical protein